MQKIIGLAAATLISFSVTAQDFDAVKDIELPEPRSPISYQPGVVSFGGSGPSGSGHIDIGHSGTTPISIGVRGSSNGASGGISVHHGGVTLSGGHSGSSSGVSGSVTTSRGHITGGSIQMGTEF